MEAAWARGTASPRLAELRAAEQVPLLAETFRDLLPFDEQRVVQLRAQTRDRPVRAAGQDTRRASMRLDLYDELVMHAWR